MRPLSVEVRVAEHEDEFISRIAYSWNVPKSTVLRDSLLRDYPPPRFEEELKRLRREQKGKKVLRTDK